MAGSPVRKHVRGCVYSLSTSLPVLYDLLSDHFNVFKTLHAADVVHQYVGVGVADASAAQIKPLLKDTNRKMHISTNGQEVISLLMLKKKKEGKNKVFLCYFQKIFE